MDISEKDDPVNNPSTDWSIPGSNPVSNSYPSSSQMIDSFGQTLWYDPTNVVGYGGAGSSSFMSWNLPNLLPSSSTSFLPHNGVSQFPTDSGFIERAARFSLFSDIVNHPESVGLFVQSNEVSEQAKPIVPGSGNVSEDNQSSGGKGGETSSKGFGKKRKKNGQDRSCRSQQSEEEEEEGDKKEQSPNSLGNKANSGKQRGGKQTSDDPPKDGYIHVRARRGQATNSHSLAERVRREKISERMKFLQDLVPGCNKVTGKAVMLDEIINYVQSLQRQVEFLSMKLATVNPQMDFNLDSLLAKDALQLRAGSSSAIPFPQNMAMAYPPLPHGIMQQTLLSGIGRNINNASLSPLNGGFKRQETNGWEGDLQNVIQINYEAGDIPPDSQAEATASLQGANMKAEP